MDAAAWSGDDRCRSGASELEGMGVEDLAAFQRQHDLGCG